MTDHGEKPAILGLSNVVETRRWTDDKQIIRVEAEAEEPQFPVHICDDPGLTPRLVHDGHRSGRRRIMDTAHAGQPVLILYRQARAKCQSCGSSGIDEIVPHRHATRQMTQRLHALIAHDALRDTHASVGRRHGVSEGTVRAILSEATEAALKKREPVTPRVIGMDETKLKRKKVAVLGNIEARTILDLFDDRKKLRAYLEAMTGRDQVEVFCSDLRGPWLGIRERYFPGAVHVADKFHVVRRGNVAIDTLCRGLQWFAVPEEQELRRQIKGLLRLRADHKEMLNGGIGVLDDLAKIGSVLPEAYWAKERFFAMYDVCKTPAEAEAYHDRWRAELPERVRPLFEKYCVIPELWRQAVFSYFDHRFTTSYVESMHRVLKDLVRAGRGYDFETLRRKLMLAPPLAKRFVFDPYPNMYVPPEDRVIAATSAHLGMDIDVLIGLLEAGELHSVSGQLYVRSGAAALAALEPVFEDLGDDRAGHLPPRRLEAID